MSEISHHATVIPVNDIEASLDFYTKKLGFDITFRWQDPTTYAVLKRDGASLHLALQDHPVNVPSNVSMYLFCYDVEALYREYTDRGVTFHESLNTADYKMKEFIVTDPAGFKIAFGQEM